MERNKMDSSRMLLSGGVLLVALIGGGVAVTQLDQCSGTQCTMEARASVLVKLVDKEGNPVSGDSVFYGHIDEDANEQLRASHRGECLDDECTEWVVARELTGIFDVHASACGALTHETGIHVGMTDDECHVDTQEITMVMEACPHPGNTVAANPGKVCTTDLKASVVVHVMDGEGDDASEVSADAVWFGVVPNTDDKNLQPEEREPPEIDPTQDEAVYRHLADCMNEDCSEWFAGWEKPGHYYVFGRTCGSVVSAEVDVPMTDDGCHVDTQHVTLVANETKCLNAG